MIAEVISIGDELTSGQRLDTNSQWLSQRLGDLGVHVRYHTTVSDDLEANIRVFLAALQRADVVVASGGLGPTADDLTRDALARAAGVPLVLDQASLDHIRSLFARHNREMPERNRLQAMFPEGARPIPNTCGTAPGIDLTVARTEGGQSRVFALPGVPAEMFEMFSAWVAPAVSSLQPEQRLIRHRRIKCFGAGESHVEQMLPDLIRRGRQPAVGITVHAATITLRVTAEGRTPEECNAAMQPTIDTIHQCLGNLVFGDEDDELENVVVRLLAERGETLATVEGGTAGLLAECLSLAARADGQGNDGFQCGVVLSSPAAAAPAFGMVSGPPAVAGAAVSASAGTPRSPEHESSALCDAAAATSEAFVQSAATACRDKFGTDYSLAIGFFPAETASSQEAAAPYYFALATAEKVTCHSGTLSSHPAIWKPRAVKQALNLLRLTLLNRNQVAKP